MAQRKPWPTSPGALNAAKGILEQIASGNMTTDAAKLAEFIDKTCGIAYLAEGCRQALALDAVTGNVEISLRGALAWAGFEADSRA